MLKDYVDAVSEAFSKLGKVFVKEVPEVAKKVMPTYYTDEACKYIQDKTGIDKNTVAEVMAANDGYMNHIGIIDFTSKPSDWIGE